MISLVGSPVRCNKYSPALCASPFFPMTRPPAQGVQNLRQPELGACILDACALKNSSERPTKKNKPGSYSPLVGRETSTRGRGCPPARDSKMPPKSQHFG